MALIGVVLFAGAGIALVSTYVFSGPSIRSTPHAPGEQFEVSISKDVVLWGEGDDLNPGAITCEQRSSTGKFHTTLPPGPPPGSEDLATYDDRERGELVCLATNAGLWRSYDISCDGPGLEAVWTSDNPRESIARNAGIGFLAAAVVAGLWGTITLGLHRRR